ncbi:MAG: hypothetical protein HYX22_00180 [Candidatus Yanofskybacteria bacterium]|nr:hypothetical protein [Candidatus Yanofskybacteria bacterium]
MDKRLAKSFIHRFVERRFFAILFCMRFNIPKNDSKYHWTQHSVRKMLFYGLTADRVKRIIRNPKRMEKGIVPDTLAAMQPVGTKKKSTEVWTMYAVKGQKKIIITAWRYPSTSPVRGEIPIPADILAELKEDGIVI